MGLSGASVIPGVHDETEHRMRIPRRLTVDVNAMLGNRNVSVENGKVVPVVRNMANSKNPEGPSMSAENEQSMAVSGIDVSSRLPGPNGNLASRPHRSRES